MIFYCPINSLPPSSSFFRISLTPHKQKIPGLASEDHVLGIVELEGVEPSSKQGNHTLSTRLFRPSIFVLRQDPDHQPQPYPLKFHRRGGARADYSRFNRTACSECFGTRASGRCLVLSPCDWIKPVIYCTSIRQRERNCFRQINFRLLILWSRQTKLRVLTYHFNPLSNPVSPGLCLWPQRPHFRRNIGIKPQFHLCKDNNYFVHGNDFSSFLRH